MKKVLRISTGLLCSALLVGAVVAHGQITWTSASLIVIFGYFALKVMSTRQQQERKTQQLAEGVARGIAKAGK